MEEVQKISDLRPISLSMFADKIISRVLHGRFLVVLPNLFSKYQTGFVKGRSIIKKCSADTKDHQGHQQEE